MPGIGVISNPRSGKNKRNPKLAKKLAYILGERHIMAEPDRLDTLHEVARHFKDHDIDVLCINGGDGTAHLIFSVFLEVWGDKPLPMIALLRGGTMNTMPRNLGITGSPEDILGRVVQLYHSGEPFSVIERNLMVVDGKHAGFLFGNGIISSFLEVYYEGGDASPWKAFKVLVAAAWSAIVGGRLAQRLTQPVRCRVRVDGALWPLEQYIAVSAGTMADIGFGFRPFYAAPNHPNHFHAVGFGCTIGDIVKSLLNVRLARSTGRADVLEAVAKRMTLEADHPIGYMVDGDFHEGGQVVTVEVGPRLRFITG